MNTIIISFLIYMLAFVKTNEAGEELSWYRGCYGEDDLGNTVSVNLSLSESAHPVSCARRCHQESFPFVAVSKETCHCVRSLPREGRDEDSCHARCSERDLEMPCGGDHVISLYDVRGPYLLSATIAPVSQAYLHHTATLETNVSFAGFLDMPLGFHPDANDDDVVSTKISVTVNFVDTSTNESEGKEFSELLLGNRSNEVITIEYTFKKPSTFIVDVCVENFVSMVTTQLSIVVTDPPPRDLQISLEAAHQPYCIPSNQNVTREIDNATWLVFEGDYVKVEAGVAIGYGVRFRWVIVGSDSTTYKATCRQPSCRSVLQEHRFSEAGEYELTVNARNQHGSVTRQVTVIALSRDILQLNMEVRKPIIELDEAALFIAVIETADNWENWLEITFGEKFDVTAMANESHRSVTKDTVTVAENVDSVDRLTWNAVGNAAVKESVNCVTTLEFQHTYKSEGTFLARLRSNGSENASVSVTVERRIHGLALHCPLVAAAGVEIDCVANISTHSKFMRVRWNITRSGDAAGPSSELIVSNRTLFNVSHVFMNPAEYTVDVAVWNDISSLQKSVPVLVELPVGGLCLRRLDNATGDLAPGSRITIHARVETGSNVVFTWEGRTRGYAAIQYEYTRNLSHRAQEAEYRFSEPGQYNITVCAYNRYNDVCRSMNLHVDYLPVPIEDQQSISGLKIVVAKVVLLGDETEIELSVATGSPVRFDIDYGSGRERVNEIVLGTRVVTHYVFTTVGIVTVTVYAHNEKSNRSASVEVEVQRGVDKVTLDVISSTHVVNESVTFLVKTQGSSDIVERNDVIFEWRVNNEILTQSRSAILGHVFTHPGTYNATVTVYNLVSRVAAIRVLVVAQSNHTRFNMATIHNVEEAVQITVVGLGLPNARLDVNYGDTQKHEVSANGSAHTWTHYYATPGFYQISVHIEHPRPVNIDTWILCQQPIRNLHISGPRALPVTSVASDYRWYAQTNSGTDILYKWHLGEKTKVTAKNNYTYSLREAKDYNLTVEASNGISQSSDSVKIVVMPVITRVAIATSVVVLGRSTQVTVEVHGAPEFSLEINYGDGVVETNVTSMTSESGEEQRTQSRTYSFVMLHKYGEAGEYLVRVNVSNAVSWQAGDSVSYVEEPIAGVAIATDARGVVEVGQLVRFNVTVESGRNLKYQWTFGDHDGPQLNVSQTVHTFQEPSTYTVTVSVWNDVQTEPVVAQLPRPLLVEQRISGLQIFDDSGIGAAALTSPSTTGDITFTAQVELGSKVEFRFDFGDGRTASVDATPVQIDFRGFIVQGQEVHRYRKVGAYNVSVTATNGLGSSVKYMDDLFQVQVKPEGLTLRPSSYTIEKGQSGTYEAEVTKGSHVRYDWDMGDSTRLRDRGAVVEYTHAQTRSYMVKVTAYNYVGTLVKGVNIHVIERIQSVQVLVDKPVHRLHDVVTFTAKVTPDKDIATFRWHLGGNVEKNSSACDASSKTLKCVYEKEDTYDVRVYAFNRLHEVVSETVQVQVLKPIGPVTVRAIGDPRINTEIEFEAYHFSGVADSYAWDFGDGTQLVASSYLVNHTYTTIQKYNVTVNVSNAVSYQFAEHTLFVLNETCQAPRIDIIGATNQPRQIKRSVDVKIEVDVEIACGARKATVYTWRLVNGTDGRAVADISSQLFHDPVLFLPARSLRYGGYTVHLKVSMRGTPIEVYTEVHTNITITPSPIRSVISGGIRRDVSREEALVMDASKSFDPDFPDDRDLDFFWTCQRLNNRSASCFTLPEEQLLLNQSKLDLHGNVFVTTDSEFVFKATVRKGDREAGIASQVINVKNETLLEVSLLCADCVDEIVNSDSRLLLEARNDRYSAQELVYEWNVYWVLNGQSESDPDDFGECEKYDYIFQGLQAGENASSTTPPTPPSAPTVTVTMASATTAASGATTAASGATTTSSNATSATSATASLASTATTTTTSSAPAGFGPRENPNPAPGFSPFGNPLGANPGVDSRTPGRKTPPAAANPATDPPEIAPSRSSSPEGSGGVTTGATPSVNASPETTSDAPTTKYSTTEAGSPAEGGLPSVGEGETPGRASSDAVPPANSSSPGMNPLGFVGEGGGGGGIGMTEGGEHEAGGRPGAGSPSAGESGDSAETGDNSVGLGGDEKDGKGDDVSRPDYVNMGTDHVVSLRREGPLPLTEADTTTGLAKRVLGLRAGYLQQGVTYIIQVDVKHKEKELRGSALTYFTVNRSPRSGRCSINEVQGTELDTEFVIYCELWKDADGDTPLTYEVSYTLDPTGPSDLLYKGLNREVRFRLPAGHPHNNYTVDLAVFIADSREARTKVCKTSVHVSPKTFTAQNGTEEEILYGLVQENSSSLQDYVQQGDNRNARLHAQIIATRLNRLENDAQDGDTRDMRQKIRRAMLWALRDLPLRDEYEIQQTTAAVSLTTNAVDELNDESLLYASDILDKASNHTFDLANSGKVIDGEVTTETVQASSNVLAAISRNPRVTSQSNAKRIVQRSNSVIHNSLHADLSGSMEEEAPVRKELQNVYVAASRLKPSVPSPTLTATNAAKFKLPADMQRVIGRRSALLWSGDNSYYDNHTVNLDCYEAHVVMYQRNPFVYSKKADQIKSKVVALSLLNCEGRQLLVEHLDPDEQILIGITHELDQREEEESQRVYTLNKANMNVHQFNSTLQTVTHTLHINAKLVPVREGRVFPMALLIRAKQAPTLEAYDLIYEFDLGEDDLHVTLKPQTLLVDEVYYLGIVDAKFNSAKRRKGEVQIRQYTLMLWWADCLFWNFTEDQWSSKGCIVSEASTFYEAQCACDHLTSFAADFSLKPNDLSIVDIDDFFDLHENPVTFSLISVIFVLYIILLVIAVRLDKRDRLKGGVIELIDNNVRDSQKYVLVFETGMRRNAGTTAKVSMVLYGEDGMSETRELISQSADQQLFERNARDTFLLTLPDSLGSLTKIQLWHNNAGSSPAWFLSRVTVKDVNSDMTYYFNCCKWFAVEHEDGKVEREVMVLEAGLGFTQVFWAKGGQYLLDYHVWLSTFTRPPYSRFTRAQRLSCCLCLLMSYMAVNAAWYRGQQEQYRGEYGLIDVSWRAFVVGLISSLLVLPPTAIIILLFRRSKVRSVEDFKAARDSVGSGESSDSLESTTRLLQPVHTPSIFDQSILNWQGLQEWAQRTWAKRYRQSPTDSTHNVQPIQTLHMSNDLHSRVRQASERDHETKEVKLHKPVSPDASISGDSQQSVTSSEAVSADDVILSLQSSKSWRCFVPGCSRYVAWITCFLITSGCAAITILYGFRFGRVKSIMWMQSLFFSLLQCVFVNHPLLILLWTLYVAYKYRNNMEVFCHHDDGYVQSKHAKKSKDKKSLDKQEEYDLADGIAARQRYRYLRFARPPQEKQLIESRNQTIKETKASKVFRESLLFAVTFLLLAFMAFGKDHTTTYRLNHSLADVITAGAHGHGYRDVSTPTQFWHWLRHDFMEIMYGSQAQNRKVGQLEVGNSVVIGNINIRQQRIIEQDCLIPEVYKRLPAIHQALDWCRYPYTKKNRDTAPYGHNGTWVYFDEKYAGGAKVSGRHGTYGGDGYLVMLDKIRTKAEQQLASMQGGEWFDRFTRAVIIEFTLFHAPTSILSSVTLLMEVPAVGRVFPRHRVASAYVYKYITAYDNFILACELLFIVAVCAQIHGLVFSILQQKKQFFSSVWNSLDVLQSVTSVAYIGCYIYRFVVVSYTVEDMRATYKEDFVDVSAVAFWDQMLRTLVGFIFFLVTLRSLRILRHRRPFATVGNVLMRSLPDILVAMLMFVVWVVAYLCLGVALFGSLSYQYHNADSALLTTAGLLTKHYPATCLESGSRGHVIMWKLFVCSLLVFALGSLTAYIMAVLNFHYKVYKKDTRLVLDIVDTIRHCWKSVLHWFGLQPVTFAEEDNTLPAEFTMAEVEYQVDEMLFKMNALAGTANLPEKPPMYFTDSDTTYNGQGENDLGVLSGGGRINIDGVSSSGQAAILRMYQEKEGYRRIERIQENLYGQEPHLAHLLHSVGADMLAREKEKQLRSQLELEIFRQLQMSRHQDSSNVGSDTYASSLSYQEPPSSSSYQGSGSQSNSSGSGSHSNPDSLTSTPTLANKIPGDKQHIRPMQSLPNENQLDEERSSHLVSHNALLLQHSAGALTSLREEIPLVTMNRSKTECGKSTSDVTCDAEKSSNKKLKWGNKETMFAQANDGSTLGSSGITTPRLAHSGSGSLVHSGSSGAIEVQSVLSNQSSNIQAKADTDSHSSNSSNRQYHNQQHTGRNKQPDVKPKSHLARTVAPGSQSVSDVKPKSVSDVTPKWRQNQPKSSKDCHSIQTHPRGAFAHIDDSSDSDLDLKPVAKPVLRTLRKTRSRGKGKGEEPGLSPDKGFEIDDFGVSNCGFIDEGAQL